MADEKTKRGGQDRKNVAGGEKYEVGYEARKLGISSAQLKAIIVRVGTDRKKIEAAAKNLKK
jgi:hypothetical protein